LKILRRIAALVLGLVLGLVAVELAVRALAPQYLITEELRWEAHPAVGFRLEPSTLVPGRIGGRINQLGLRGPELGSPSADETRVLVLGDSFVYGAGVTTEEALPRALEDVARAAGHPWRFVNAGTPSYGTVRLGRWLETFGEQVRADRVLLAVFVGNDFTDNLDEQGPGVVDGRLVAGVRPDAPAWRARARLWLGKSHLVRLVRQRGALPPPPPPPPAPAPASDTPPDPDLERRRQERLHALQDAFARTQSERLGIYAPAGRLPAHLEPAIGVMDASLDRILAWCRARDLPFEVVILPDVTQVEERVQERAAAAVGLTPDLLDLERPQRALLAWCERNAVRCVDLLPAFREHMQTGGESLYLFTDSHFNAAGHAFAARHAAEVLGPGWWGE
jgi:hypothetical protein